MKLIKSIIQNKLNYHDNSEINNTYDNWSFYQTLNLTCKINKKQKNYREHLWQKILQKKTQAQIALNIQTYKDRQIINQYLKKETEQEIDTQKTPIYKKGTFAIATYELE